MFRNKNLIMKNNMRFKFKILRKNGSYLSKSENLKNYFQEDF